MNKDRLHGGDIFYITTSGSMFNKDILIFTDRYGNKYKMNIKELFKFNDNFSDLIFRINRNKGRDWNYLEVV